LFYEYHDINQYDVPLDDGIGAIVDEIVPSALKQVINFIDIVVMTFLHAAGIVLLLLGNEKGLVPDIMHILFIIHNATSLFP
jgi:hypothetical protein